MSIAKAPEPRRIGRPRGPSVDRAARREELLDAAARAIRRVGASASMEQLAAEAGITKPILYSHFGDKSGLASALADRFASDIRTTLLSVLNRPQEERAMLRATVDAFIGFVEAEPEIFRFLLYGAFRSTESLPQRQLFAELGEQITAIVGAALDRAGSNAAAAEPWAYSMLGAALATAEWWLERQTMSRNEVVDHVTDLLWAGLSGAASSA